MAMNNEPGQHVSLTPSFSIAGTKTITAMSTGMPFSSINSVTSVAN